MNISSLILCKPISTIQPVDNILLSKSLDRAFSATDSDQTKQLRVILDFKSRILSELNLPIESDDTKNQSKSSFNLSSEMRDLLDLQMQSNDNNNNNNNPDNSNTKIDLIKLKKSTNCKADQCFEIALPISNYELEDYLINKDILDAKLIIPTTYKSAESNISEFERTVVLINSTEHNSISIKLNSALQRDEEIDVKDYIQQVIRDSQIKYQKHLNQNRYKSKISYLKKSHQPILDKFNDLSANFKVGLVYPYKTQIKNNNSTNLSNSSNLFVDVDNILLELHIRDSSKVLKRRKRSTTNYCAENQYFCCTHKLVVTLEELKLDGYIVAPKSFVLNYCGGDCNSYMRLSSNHALGLGLVNNRRQVSLSEKRSMTPCCVPYSYSSLVVFYVKENNEIEYRQLHNVMADSCGCL